MRIYEIIKNAFIIITDKSKLDIYFMHKYLSEECYWAKNIPLNTVKKVLMVPVVVGFKNGSRKYFNISSNIWISKSGY